jgi:hypothetical protein
MSCGFYFIEVGKGKADEVIMKGETSGLQQTREIVVAKRCMFSSLNGVGSWLLC